MFWDQLLTFVPVFCSSFVSLEEALDHRACSLDTGNSNGHIPIMN